MVSEELKAVRDTLTYMKENLPYYKDVLASVDVTTFQLEDMTILPLTTKDDLKKDPKSFIAHKLTPEYVAWTGGTTGNAIPVYMAREEFAEMYNTPPGRKKRFLGIQVHNTDHGLPLKTPTDVFWLDHFLDTLVQNRNLENIITDLTTTHCIPGVDELPRIISFTSQENLKALTLELLRRGITDTPVKFIFGTGDYISPYWVNLVEKVFGGKYIDCYANTETTTVAVCCGQCGYFHVNPTVFTEVVDTKTLEPVTEGSGFFVVTTLYPYRKMQ
jgi:phenylacetate-coenzyme A ligase PaaK-like adenylate-forming protein